MLLSLPHLYITSVNQLVQSLLPPTCPSSQSLFFLGHHLCLFEPPDLSIALELVSLFPVYPPQMCLHAMARFTFQNHKSNDSILQTGYDHLPLSWVPSLTSHHDPGDILCFDISTLLAEGSMPSHVFQFFIPILAPGHIFSPLLCWVP